MRTAQLYKHVHNHTYLLTYVHIKTSICWGGEGAAGCGAGKQEEKDPTLAEPPVGHCTGPTNDAESWMTTAAISPTNCSTERLKEVAKSTLPKFGG